MFPDVNKNFILSHSRVIFFSNGWPVDSTQNLDKALKLNENMTNQA